MRSRTGSILLIAVLLAVINLPLLHSTYYDRRIENEGVDVQARVVENQVLSSDSDATYLVQFEFDPTIDPEQRRWLASVNERTYDDAVESTRLPVRVLPDRPAAYRVAGQIESNIGLLIAMVANVIVLGIAFLFWRRGRGTDDEGTGDEGGGSLPGVAPRAITRVLATSDVERCKPGGSLVQLDGGVHLVTGEVCGIDDNGLMLDLGDRRVRVELDGHANPVGYQQPARVTGLLLE